MKKLAILVLFLVLSCKNNTPQKSEKQDSLSLKNTAKIHYKTLADSLHLFSMMPSEFNEYYLKSNLDIKNKEYMRKVIEQCNKDFVPYLIEKVMDTTETTIDYANVTQIRTGDIAFELISISDRRLNTADLVYSEFNKSDLIRLSESNGSRLYSFGSIYVPLFFKEPKFKHVNYKNRERIYLALKKQYSALEKNKK